MSWFPVPLGEFQRKSSIFRMTAGEGEMGDFARTLKAVQDWATQDSLSTVPAGGQLLFSWAEIRFRFFPEGDDFSGENQAAEEYREFIARKLDWKTAVVSRELLAPNQFALNWTSEKEPGDWVPLATLQLEEFSLIRAEQATKAYFAEGHLIPLRTWLLTGELPAEVRERKGAVQRIASRLSPIVGGRAAFVDCGDSQEEVGCWWKLRV